MMNESLAVEYFAGAIAADVSSGLADFERQFRYPLEGGWFHISHGIDYTRFYRSLGEAGCALAREGGAVRGLVSCAVRELHQPGRSARRVLYLGDLKLAAFARGGRTLWRLARILRTNHPATDEAYAVVMQGTPVDPSRYTGRAGIPAFTRLGHVRLWRLPTSFESHHEPLGRVILTDADTGMRCFREMSIEHCFSLSGNAKLRSNRIPQWWIADDGSACGRLEDTLSAKRLFRDTGEEMVSAHLAAFAYRDPHGADRLLQHVLRVAAAEGYPALFVALPVPHGPLPRLLANPPAGTSLAAAQVYGTAGLGTAPWNVFTSEI